MIGFYYFLFFCKIVFFKDKIVLLQGIASGYNMTTLLFNAVTTVQHYKCTLTLYKDLIVYYIT